MTHAPKDLADRLLEFAASTCRIAVRLPRTVLGNHVAGQLIRSCTAPAAHHAEARSAESPRDFMHKMKIGLKELRETMRWLRWAGKTKLVEEPRLAPAISECNELIAIFVKSVTTARRNWHRREVRRGRTREV